MVNESIPKCPRDAPKPLNHIEYPTTTLIFIVYAVTTLVFATIIAFKYNSVKVFNKKIRTQNISNTLWIIYYISMGIRYVKIVVFIKFVVVGKCCVLIVQLENQHCIIFSLVCCCDV
jgi:hypothetical protein